MLHSSNKFIKATIDFFVQQIFQQDNTLIYGSMHWEIVNSQQ